MTSTDSLWQQQSLSVFTGVTLGHRELIHPPESGCVGADNRHKLLTYQEGTTDTNS